MSAPPSYSVAPIPTLFSSTTSSSTATSTKVTSSTISHSSRASTKDTITTSISSTVTSTTSSNVTPTDFVFLAGMQGTATTAILPEASIVAADYKAICPDGCLTDCQNMTRLFQSVPDGIDVSPSTYGIIPPGGGLPDVTLFGVCTNLAGITELASTANISSFTPYFSSSTATASLQNVTNGISICLIETCQATRDPLQCLNECSLEQLQATDTSLSMGGTFACLFRLCNGDCGLPYANQDVYGVGLLASYITQAILVLILALVLIASASWLFFMKRDNTKPKLAKKLTESLAIFLSAQCYFGVSAAIASFFMKPATVDPLNGYALLSVAITGFLPTTVTLMLLHSHGIKSWYTTLLTLSSWLVSTVLFFTLVRNLSKSVSQAKVFDEGLSALFQVESCGKSAAMSICKQTFDSDPLAYLSRAYHSWSIPNIKTVPILWVLSTVVLICLVVLQTFDKPRHRTNNHKLNAVTRLGSLFVGSLLFGLAIGYQARMVIVYTNLDVIDWDGWSFGQVVALLFWVPALLDCIRSYLREAKEDHKKSSGYSKLDGNTSAQSTPTLPSKLPPTPTPAQGQPNNVALEPLRQNVGRSPTSDIELVRLPRKPVPTSHIDST